jgi:hypothetical protein
MRRMILEVATTPTLPIVRERKSWAMARQSSGDAFGSVTPAQSTRRVKVGSNSGSAQIFSTAAASSQSLIRPESVAKIHRCRRSIE